MLKLLKNREFASFLVIVFLNAFTDIGHKMIVHNAVFKYYSGATQILFTALINILMIAPYIAVFTPAGFLADRFSKRLVMRYVAACSIPLAIMATWCYANGWFELAFGLTFAFAAQSALFSPSKYGYIRELVGKEALGGANSLVQTTTIGAILTSVIVISTLFERLIQPGFTSVGDVLIAMTPLGVTLIAATVAETALTWRLTKGCPANPALRFKPRDYFSGRYVRHNLQTVRHSRAIWLSVVGLALFAGVNQVVLSALPEFIKSSIGVTSAALSSGALALGGIGIAIGALCAGKLSRRQITTGVVPLSAAGMTLSLLLLPGIASYWALAALVLLYGIFGGLFVVPLHALIQYHADADDIGRTVAASNFIQHWAMIIFLAFAIVCAGGVGIASFAVDTTTIFIALSAIAFGGAVYAASLLKREVVGAILTAAFACRYSIRAYHSDNIPASGGALLLGSHTSFIDWAIVQIATPRPIRFVMARTYYDKRFLRPFFDLFGVIPISSGASKDALRTISALLEQGEIVVLFPEGRVSRDGRLAQLQKGFEIVARTANAPIIPFHIQGLWGSIFSCAPRFARTTKRFPRRRATSVHFGEPLPSAAGAAEVQQRIRLLAAQAWARDTDNVETIPELWLHTVRKQPAKLCMANYDGVEFSRAKALTAALAFAHKIRRLTGPHKNIGMLLPTSAAGSITTMAIFLSGKTVVPLNYTAGVDTIAYAIKKAGITNIISSRRFIALLRDRGIDISCIPKSVDVYMLEDLKEGLSKLLLLGYAAAVKLLPARLLHVLFGSTTRSDDTAAILFSSGSEGRPKGIELTHRNLVANIRQISRALHPRPDDVILSSLPTFHAFGLTVTTLMPLVEGTPFVCQPDPTDAAAIGKLTARYGVTLLCGTSTFLGIYARSPKLHALMFASLRLAVGGAEKLNSATRDAFRGKFGCDVYEGYGATEVAPVAAVNTPDALSTKDWFVQTRHKPGTVGQPLPGTVFKIVDPDTLVELPTGAEGLILIAGPQVMKGYLDDEQRTLQAIIHADGMRWYKTGDKGRLDDDGFLTIVDRYSRFAKIGGEMVSLGYVEEAIRRAIGSTNAEVAAVALPDGRKGERIVVLVGNEHADRHAIRSALLQADLLPLYMPKAIIPTPSIPKLGSGKTDYSQVQRLALECVAA